MILWISIGGFFGAISRYGISQVCKKKLTSSFPYGTFIVNIIGSFGLGLLVSLSVSQNVLALLGVGFFGAFTTFSTFKLENIKLLKKKKMMLLYLMFSYGIGLMVAFIGLMIGSHF